MPEPQPRDARTRPLPWLLVIVVTGVAVFYVTGFTVGTCSDSADPAKSYCESGPMIGVAGVWLVWLGWLAFAGFGIWRLSRRT